KARLLAENYPSRNVNAAEVNEYTPGTTFADRLSSTHSLIQRLLLAWPHTECLVADVGVGYLPITTRQLADALGSHVKVIGVDNIIPAMVLTVQTDGDGKLLPAKERITAVFDDAGLLLYGYRAGDPLTPSDAAVALGHRDRLLQERRGSLATETLKDEHGNS